MEILDMGLPKQQVARDLALTSDWEVSAVLGVNLSKCMALSTRQAISRAHHVRGWMNRPLPYGVFGQMPTHLRFEYQPPWTSQRRPGKAQERPTDAGPESPRASGRAGKRLRVLRGGRLL